MDLLLLEIDLNLPLQNPVLIFSILLFIILFAPLILNQLRIPHVIGLIVAGIVVGPYGLGVMERDSSIILFGTVGLLYIMFLAGLEIDLSDFRKNRKKSIIFGLYTFSIPMVLGTAAGYYILNFSMVSSILLASMFASHTLVAYPIASRFGVTRNIAVNITVGGTMITDTLALLVLAIIVGMERGEIGQAFWIRLVISVILFGSAVLFGFPPVARWFFKKFEDSVSQYIFVLALVFLAAFFAELAGIEAIIGAFLAGLALNRLIPHTSPLMNRVEFVGNALFIPFFLIGVGMLVDLRVLLKGPNALIVAFTMTAVATLAKWLAAALTQVTFKLDRTKALMIFGLSNAQAAATLAAVLIGYNLNIFGESVLNGTILMILVTCTISSFVVEKASRDLALQEESISTEKVISQEKTLVSLYNPENVNNLVDLAIFIKDPRKKNSIYALTVVDEGENASLKALQGKRMLINAARHAAATDHTIKTLTRYDVNVSSGIVHSMRENEITELIVGWSGKINFVDKFFGSLTENVLKRSGQMLMIAKIHQPLNTIRRITLIIPANSEHEPGYRKWLDRIKNLHKQTTAKLVIYASTQTLAIIRKAFPTVVTNEVTFNELEDITNVISLSKNIAPDDLFIIISARKASVSYHPQMERLLHLFTEHFNESNFIIVYPSTVESEFPEHYH